MPGPPPDVLRAFGVEGPARPFAGVTWRAGDLVFKPEGGPVLAWLAEALAGVGDPGCRVVAPVGVHEGWSAAPWVAGTADPANWAGVLAAGRAFHRAVAHLPRPPCLDQRDDPWVRADRAAWADAPSSALAARLWPALEPMGEPQLVHGDLSGNVLFAPGLPPAIIDISPYWRPPAYAEGIAVADALLWHGATPGILPAAGVPVTAVARGLLFRMGTAADHEAPLFESVIAGLGW